MEGKIYKAISGVMKDIGAIGKDQENTFDKYKFRGIDDVYNALQPALIKNGVFAVPRLLEINQTDRVSKKGDQMIHTTVKVEYSFYAEDGSSVTVVVPGEAADRSDKSVNKAMSAAFKYACFQTFCIPVKEMLDADKDSPEIGVETDASKLKASKGMISVIEKKIKEENLDKSRFLAGFHIEKIEDLTVAQYQKALNVWPAIVEKCSWS